MTIELLSDFVGQNYFWILIIGLVLIMALIGFIADKKNLVKLDIKPKQQPKEEKNIIENLQEKSLADVVYESNKQQEVVEPIADEKNVEINNNNDNESVEGVPAELFAPLGDNSTPTPLTQENPQQVTETNNVSIPNIEESNNLTNAQEINNNTINGMEIVNFDISNEEPTPVDANLLEKQSEGNSLEEVKFDLPETVSEENNNTPIEVDLPNLTPESEQETDDIWKF